MSPEEIAQGMTGLVSATAPGRSEALLPSPMVQNHAAFLHMSADGTLFCLWFGGSLEGKSDISIHASALLPGAERWSAAQQLSHDPDHSEQNPVLFATPDGRLWLFHTSQAGGNQDGCRVRMVPLTRDPADPARLIPGAGRFLDDLPPGCFVRAPVTLRADGAWLLPIFRCMPRPGQKWTGSHDVATVGVSTDDGQTWHLQEVPGSTGSVHMSPVPLADGSMPAFYRRRQSDRVHRSLSVDGGFNWSAPEPTDLPNNNSSIAATRLRDGRLALICNLASAATSPDRRASLYDELGEDDTRPDADPAGGCVPIWGVPRAPVAVCLSSDGGRSFPQRIVIENGPGTCTSNDSTDGRNRELSYPWLLEGPDGSLHIAYTYHRRAIKYVRLAPGWADAEPARKA